MEQPTDLDITASSSDVIEIPQSADVKTMKPVTEIVGIPVLNLDAVIEDDVDLEAEENHIAEEAGWTQVTECKDLVLKQGFHMFENKPLVVKPWSGIASMAKEHVKAVPVWIRFCGLGLKFKGEKCLGKLVSLIWTYMRADESTLDKTRLGYARLMVEQITVEVSDISSGDMFLYIVVYGSNSDIDRQRLWAQLNQLKDQCDKAWCICGDFNSLLHFNERLGSDVLWSDIRDFRHCVEYCGVTDIQAHGSFFTWNNKQNPTTRVFSRVDRCLNNLEWMYLYPDSSALFMNIGNFDHCPCICYRRTVVLNIRPFFIYFNMWSMDPSFTNIITQEWGKQIARAKLYEVVTKLRNLKQPLKHLNKNRFSDIEKSTKIAKLLLDDLQTQMHSNPYDHHILAAEQEADESFRTLSKATTSYLHQKAKDPLAIEHAFLDYYTHLLGSTSQTPKVHKPTIRTGNCITEQHTSIFLKPVANEEIKHCIFSLPTSKSPGPDGYTSQFFRDSKDILLKQLNTTNITLIPKLGEILPDIVSINEGGFVKGRNIVENVLICQDIVQVYNRKYASRRCLLKIELKKVYDLLSGNSCIRCYNL
ncbi:uncharacterized protein LOC141613644 [Silene latifolia]|uniref:uncharacterized protein LOC141613644 n=1 Tax=Silene latifolia TaxID=37657 RepID=UPI003D77EDFD